MPIGGGITVFHGTNGAGKTNALEALSWALSARSPRTSAEVRCVRSGASTMSTQAIVMAHGVEHEIEATLTVGGGKAVSLDGSPVAVGALRGLVTVVSFFPEHVIAVRGSAARRREYIDARSQLLFLDAAPALREYGRAVAQRNALLRRMRSEGRTIPPEDMGVWTDAVIATGGRLRQLRERTVTAVQQGFCDRYRELTSLDGASLHIEYREEDLAATLTDLSMEEIRRGATIAGPHLDDLAITVDGRDLRTMGSTGEQRAAMLALTLAMADACDGSATPSIIMLDEPFAELDRDRRARLVESLAGHRQAVITTTDAEAQTLGASLAGASMVCVAAGRFQ